MKCEWIMERLRKFISISLGGGGAGSNHDPVEFTALMMAVRNGDVSGVERLLDQGVDVDERGAMNATALIYAAIGGNSKMLRLLICAGANVLAQAEGGETALSMVCRCGNAAVVVDLIEAVGDEETKTAMVEQPRDDGVTPLIAAASCGHVNTVAALLAHGVDLQAKNKDGLNALWHGILNDHVDVVACILANGANVEERFNDLTPLMSAALKGQADVVRILVENGAKGFADWERGNSAINLAAGRGHVDTVMLLISEAARHIGEVAERLPAIKSAALVHASISGHSTLVCVLIEDGTDPCFVWTDGQTALSHAAFRGHAHVVRLLVHGGADVTTQNRRGYTPFAVACRFGKIESAIAMVEALEEMNATEVQAVMLEMARPDGTTPIIAAASGGHLEVIVYLIDHGVNIDSMNQGGETALYIAIEDGHDDIAQYLLSNGADANCQNAQGVSPLLLITAGAGKLNFLRMLVEHDGHLEAKDHRGRTPLWYAVLSSQVEAVKYLISVGADANTSEMGGASLLHSAILARTRARERGFDHSNEVVALLVQEKVEIDAVDKYGQTALIFAASFGYADIVKTLLVGGADRERQLNMPTRGTALYHAALGGYDEIVRLLVDHNANVNTPGGGGYTPLLVAAVKGNTKMCELLLRHGADAAAMTSDGRTALHSAAMGNQRNTVQILVDVGSDINHKDNYGLTAAYYAAINGHFEMVEYLEKFPGVVKLVDTEDNTTWPLSTLLRLYGRSEECASQVNPIWFIDASAVTEDDGQPIVRPMSTIHKGAWLGSDVVIVKPTLDRDDEGGSRRAMFVQEVSMWFPLSHPNVLKLYGACHTSEPFLVVEHSQGTLRSYLRANPGNVWRTLHQIAMGLEHLHERGIFHGKLHGDIISIGDDGLPKIAGFGPLLGSNGENWTPPEVLKGSGQTAEVDVYSLGMCIIEAKSGDVPYAKDIAEGSSVRSLIAELKAPTMPTGFQAHEWNLVESMICDPSSRLTMPVVVQELEMLATEEERTRSSESDVSISELKEKLEEAEKLHKETRATLTYHADVELLSRLAYLLHFATSAESTALTRTRYSVSVDRFVRALEIRRLATEANQYAIERQHIGTLLSLEIEIDRMMETLFGGASVTSHWRQTCGDAWLDQQKRFEADLLAETEQPKMLNADRIEKLTCTLFELTRHSTSYAAIPSQVTVPAQRKIQAELGEETPDWFLPWYEVDLASGRFLQEGGFGLVYRGRWMGSQVVLKKLKQTAKFDQADFIHEVEIWFKLHHPHVVKLFGACHVGQIFFVSEWAEHGQLDQYLQTTHGRHHMWQRLYEAALGLQYLHSRGILHCDLKCNNILVGRDGKAKLNDFGLSSVVRGAEIDGAQQTFGNVRWTAPELLDGEQPSCATDIYALGMCLIEAASGTVPYFWKTDNAELKVLLQSRIGFHPRPDAIRSDAHWDLVLRCCTFESAKRAELSEVLKSLHQFARNEEAALDVSDQRIPVEKNSITGFNTNSGVVVSVACNNSSEVTTWEASSKGSSIRGAIGDAESHGGLGESSRAQHSMSALVISDASVRSERDVWTQSA